MNVLLTFENKPISTKSVHHFVIPKFNWKVVNRVPQLRAEAKATTEAPTTEPNWYLICLDLCKIGEGGVLCKCDLLPFTI